MVVVGRHIEGVCLNPIEYLLGDDGEKLKFENILKAKEFLIANGIEDSDDYPIDDSFVFEEE